MNITNLVDIANALSLGEVDALGCRELKELSNDFSNLKQLHVISLTGCTSFMSLVALSLYLRYIYMMHVIV